MNQYLSAAILKKDKFAIEDFLKAGADPNALIPGEEFAPIHLGAGTSKSVTQLLLKYGADPNARTCEGSTPLHIAASWGKSDVLQLLLKYGADMSIRDSEELDALGIAGKYECENCVRILQNHERKNGINNQGKEHRLSSPYNQIEINVCLNRIKLFSTIVNSSSELYQIPDDFTDDGPITVKTYKTKDDYNCRPRQSDDDILTPSRNSSSISLSETEEFSATFHHEQVQKNNKHEEGNQSGDPCSDTKIRQESIVHEKSATKVDDTLMNNKQQNRFYKHPKGGSDQCWKESIETPSIETFIHPPRNRHQALEIYDSDSNCHTSSSYFNGAPRYATENEGQNLNTETIYIDQGSGQTSTLPYTEYHLDLGSETNHNERDGIDLQVSDNERNKESLEYKQWDEYSKHQRQNMTKNNYESRKSLFLDTKTIKSVTQNSPRVSCSCNNHPVITTDPPFKSGIKTGGKCLNKEFCEGKDENIHSSRSCKTVSDCTYPDDTSQNTKYKYIAQQEDSKDEIPFRSFVPCKETSENTAKRKSFRNTATVYI